MKKNKILIIIILLLSVGLIATGLVLALTKNKDSSEIKEQEETIDKDRCSGNICISNISIQDVDGINSVIIILKNEGKEVVKNSCYNIITGTKEHEMCSDNFGVGEEIHLIYDYTDDYGTTVADYEIKKTKDNN